MKVKLSQEERIEIKQLHKTCKQRKYADRLKAILLLNEGLSCIEVGEILLLDDDTIRIYINTYLSKGADSLLTNKNKGKDTFLNSEQLELLANHITENTYMDSKGISAWIAKQFDVNYSC